MKQIRIRISWSFLKGDSTTDMMRRSLTLRDPRHTGHGLDAPSPSAENTKALIFTVQKKLHFQYLLVYHENWL